MPLTLYERGRRTVHSPLCTPLHRDDAEPDLFESESSADSDQKP